MDWTLLGIVPTRDKKAITAAYRGRLTSVNPEDKPEEFKALRGAYEEALRLADTAEEPSPRDESPVGLWMERVRALYGDFSARIQTENWKELLGDQVCLALDRRPAAEEALLRFFMEDCYHLPQPVWQVLDEVFAWSERREELYESYPRDFVDYAIMNGIRFPSTLPYELFIPGRDGAVCDQYRILYYQANNGRAEEMGPILERMAALPEHHPYGEALLHRCEIETGRVDEGVAGYQKLAEAYPDDVTLVYGWASLCAEGGGWEESERLLHHVLTLQPDHALAKRLLSDCLANTGRQEEAKDLVFELMHAAGGDRRELYYLEQVVKKLNKTLILRWEDRLKECPEDSAAALKLGWCYLQSDRTADALRLCEDVDGRCEDTYDFHRLYAKAQYLSGAYGESLTHLEQVEEMLWALDPDCTGEEAGRLRHLPETLQMAGSCLYALDRREEGRKKFEQAVRLAPEDPEILTKMAYLLFQEKAYDHAAETLEKLAYLLPNSYHSHFLLAQVLDAQGRDREAFDEVERALELDGSDLGVYVLKMEILLRNSVWDEVESILDFIHQSGIADDLSVLWCEAQLTELGRGEREKALVMYQSIARWIEAGEIFSKAARVYYRITVLMAQQRDARRAEDRAQLLEQLDKALAHDSGDPDCMDYKAWLLKRDGRDREAMALYHRLETLPNHGLNVERELAELYYGDLYRYADKALHYYRLLLDREETAALHFYAGICCRYLGDLAGSEKHFRREKDLDPNDTDAYRSLAYVYEAMERNEDALKNAEEVIRLQKNKEGDQSRHYFRRVQILRRMGRPREAMAAVDEIAEKFGFEARDHLKFDICCQFGLWDEAREHLDTWERSGVRPEWLAASRIWLDLYLGRYDEARSTLAENEEEIDAEGYLELRIAMDELDGNTAAQLQNWERHRGGAEEYTDFELHNLAQVHWWNGEYELARTYARKVLEQEDEALKLFQKDSIIYHSRRVLMLAMLGRERQAWDELELVRSLPLIEKYDHSAWRDADIYAANIQEVLGNFREAMELYRAGGERWPDDIDFASGRRRMERRGL